MLLECVIDSVFSSLVGSIFNYNHIFSHSHFSDHLPGLSASDVAT